MIGLDDLGKAAGLSREQLELLERLLEEEGLDLPRGAAIRARGGDLDGGDGSDGRGELSLSFPQRRLWFLHQLDPASPAYNMPAAVRLSGRLDAMALERSLSEIVRRHAALRTTFETVAGEPRQVIAPAAPVPLPRVDLRGLPPEARTREARRLVREEALRPFDLARGPLLRQILIALEPAEHVVLATMHHIVSDGWSIGVLVRELGALYAAFSQGRPSPLPELPIQYADFAAWQRRRLAGEELAEQLAWWRSRLAGAPPVLELPADRPQPAVRTSRGGRVPLLIDERLTADLEALARGRGLSLFVVLLSALAALLHRYSGQSDLTIGSPIANRTRLETEGLIGFFANTLVLRASLGSDPPYDELLERMRQVTTEAWAHQDVPFEILVEDLHPQRDLGVSPLFQVMLAMTSALLGPLQLPGLTAAPLEREAWEEGAAKFDLTFDLTHLAQGSAGLRGSLEYSRDLFDPTTARRITTHFELLLRAVAVDPSRRLSELELLAPAERQQVLVEWRAAAGPRAPEEPVHRLFTRQAARRPDAVAVIGGDAHLTYGELSRQADRISRRLRGLGVGPDVPVALCAGRSPELIAGILGILGAGGAYVPLDPGSPRQRSALLLEESGAPVLLVEQDLAGGFAETAAQVVALEAACAAESGEVSEPAAEVSPDGLAYVMYTSGSTGRPKGVAVVHRAVVRLVQDTGYARFGPEEVWLQLAPPSFDAATLEIWGALLHGGRLVLAPDRVLTPAELGGTLSRHGVTSLWLTAGLFHQMVEENLAGLRPVRQLLAGGDVLSPEHVRRALAGLPGTRLINGYGPTENTTFTCCHPMDGPEDVGSPVPLGRPIANTWVSVLDESLRPVPPGVAGELCAGGGGLARGYHGRPELTAERFVPDPFADRADQSNGRARGDRLYRTGDLVRYLPDGRIEFLGRLDRQVKVRGFRVEPGEVESALMQHPRVREAVVVTREIAGSRALAAYVVGKEHPIAARDLREHLRTRLPEHMFPAAFVALSELPLTPNGKVDRRALPDPEREPSTTALSEPRSPAEELLAVIWAEVLGLERVGIHDSFFDLGGHSLLATRTLSRVRATFGVELPLAALFASPTVAELAAAVEEARRRGTESAPPLVPLPPAARDGDLPLSFAQERLWFLDRLEPGSPVYNIPVVVLLEGELEAAALRRALETVVSRHGGLRTTFRETSGRPFQVVASALAIPLPVVDLGGLSEAERAEEVHRLTTDEALRPFNLETGPLFRAALIRSDRKEHRLFLTLHHIIADGWSMGVLVREVQTLYRATVEGGLPELPALPVQYADYAVWQRSWLSGEALASRLSWWREQLQGAPAALDLPTVRPRPAVASHRGAGCSRELSQRLWAAIEVLARREGATPFLVVLTALEALLARYTGADDLTIGTPVAGRACREVEDLVGFFVNTLVLRADLSGDPCFRDLLVRARAVMLGAHAHQDLPFERLVEELEPKREIGRTPLFQVMLASGHLPIPLLELPGLRLSAVEPEARVSKFDLTVFLTPREEGALLHLLYRTDLFEKTTVERLTDHIETLLEGVVAEPSLRLSELPLMRAAERQETIVELNRTVLDFPLEGTIHAAFAEQARRTPRAVAVACGSRSLSFGEVERRARALAVRLRHLDVGPEARVGLCCGRRPEALVGILGVLMAGGAYVPIEPSWPIERVSWMLADSGAALLLTEERVAPALPGVHTLLLEDEEQWEGASSPLPEVSPEGAAYVIYTSGSTGRPKGVVVRHRSVLNLAAALRKAVYGDCEALRVGVNASLSFDGSVKQLVQLLSGHTLQLVPEETRLDPTALLDLLRRERIDVLDVTPSQLRPLLEAGLSTSADGSPALVLIGGEVLDRETWEIARSRPRTRFVNVYGPTECTVDATALDLALGLAPASIGWPLPNVRTYLVDRWGQPAPVGVAGELWIGGEGVARGYLGQPALTAERFVPAPFGSEPGGRLYRSGDLVRLGREGAIEYLGRIDQQVKVRGYRVEPGEVEAALRKLPAVCEAAVTARGGRLAAYLVPAPGGNPVLEDLRRSLEPWLPSFLIPSVWVILESLPLTASGKIDRNALPEPEAADQNAGAEQTRPRTPTEDLVAAIFADLLRVERVGAGEQFFELGGHSLLATQVISRLRGVFGVELPLRALFERPGVAELAEAVEEARRGAPGRAVPPLVPVARDGDLPLSFAQERLWFLDQLEPGKTAYNIPAAFTLSGPLDAQALTAAYNEILRRHEALRTTFTAVDGQPVQRISPPTTVSVPIIDLEGLPPGDRQAAASRLAAEDAWRELDLARGPLVRLMLLRLGRDEHLAVLGMHHIVADGWSMQVLVRELVALYPAFVIGAASPLPELPVQYADYAVWQRDWLRGEVLASEVAFWREALAGAPRVLELPADRSRPPATSGRGGARTTRLSPALTSALTAFGRREGFTLFMTLLATWNTLLFRASEQTDLVVGVPIANRNRLETEGLIGFFTNTLALRSRPTAGTRFLDLARAVRETALQAYSHQDLPFERLVEELAPERSLAHTPLFQVLFSLQNLPAGELALPGLTLAPRMLAQQTAKFDLSLFLVEAGDELVATLEFSTDLFDAVTAERLLERFRTSLEGAVADPGRRLAELPLLPVSERHQILWEWNEVPAGEGPPCVHHLVAAQARRTPGAAAVLTADGTEISYGDLDRLADRLARRLRELGVRPDDRVGVCLERSWEGVVALLAVLRAGGCHLPLDPAYPRERLGFVLADAAAPVIVTRDRLAAALPPHGARVLSIDEGWPEPAGGELPEVGLEHLAYAIYTSGSTGRPKGVALPHRTLANLIAWQIGASAASDGRTLQFASASFDVSLQEILATWAAGGTLVLLTEEARGDAEALLRRLVEARVERLFLPFVALQQLAEAAAAADGALPPLREVLTAGEQLQITAEVKALFARLPGCVLRNQYGPSEAHVVTESTLWSERPGEVETWPALPPIGRPIATTEAHLLDPRGAPVPIGVPGEVCLGGAGLARGYLGRPDLTAERFVPAFRERGGRLYRTGDLARRRASGEIEFLGRIDHQVKIRGFRIEPGEIEAVLAMHPAVREAVVVTRGEGARRRLVAYVLPATRGNLGDLLRAHLRERLPDYMVPAAFVPIESLPLTPSGKVDRKALVASGPEAREFAKDDAPRTPAEELLAGIWTEVLGLERVGIHDGFFDLGGHSLLAARVVARLRSAFGVELPLRALFERPSVAELAELLSSLTRRSHGLAAPPLERVSGSLEPPLSFAQQSLWLIDRIEGGSATYNMMATLELAGRLDVAALAGSFQDVVERHAVLRTGFALRGGEPRQVIHPRLEVPLLLADLSALPTSRREEALETVHRQLRRPFDLAQAPLLRTALLRLAPDLHALQLCLHHIVSDAWSLGILVRELAACYGARARASRAALPPLPIQYADYADWQRRWLRGEALEKLLAFWRRQLGTEPPAARLPALRPAPAVRTRRGGRRTFLLSAGLEPALRALARREGVTLFMLLLGAFQTLLHRSTGQEDLVLVAAASRRDHLETEGLIGCFLNMLPLRASVTGDLSFRRLLQRVREICLDAFAHQDMPFERLVAELRLHGENGRSPFQVAFGVQSAPPPLPELPGLAIRLLESGSGVTRLDLTLWVTEQPQGLSAAWTYSADLFDGEEIDRLHGLYEALLTAVVIDPDARLRNLALTAVPERESESEPSRRWEDVKKRKLHETRRRSVRG